MALQESAGICDQSETGGVRFRESIKCERGDGKNDFLLRLGGHIGYAVVPEFRRQGYATAMLRQSVDIARHRFGLTRVLLTCDDDNVGSIRTIEKNGGVLENVIAGPDLLKPKRRYWIG